MCDHREDVKESSCSTASRIIVIPYEEHRSVHTSTEHVVHDGPQDFCDLQNVDHCTRTDDVHHQKQTVGTGNDDNDALEEWISDDETSVGSEKSSDQEEENSDDDNTVCTSAFCYSVIQDEKYHHLPSFLHLYQRDREYPERTVPLDICHVIAPKLDIDNVDKKEWYPMMLSIATRVPNDAYFVLKEYSKQLNQWRMFLIDPEQWYGSKHLAHAIYAYLFDEMLRKTTTMRPWSVWQYEVAKYWYHHLYLLLKHEQTLMCKDAIKTCKSIMVRLDDRIAKFEIRKQQEERTKYKYMLFILAYFMGMANTVIIWMVIRAVAAGAVTP